MTQPRTVAVLVGSLRKASLTRKVAEALATLAPADLKLKLVEIGDLPFYNEDIEGEATPAEWTRFRDEVRVADAVLFATPEYNRSVPGVLKNAIDVGSRPYGQSVYAGKPAAVVSQSQGSIGGFGANHHLRQSLVFLGMPALPLEVYLSQSASLFDDDGRLAKPDTEKFLKSVIEAFAEFIDRNAAA